MRYQINRWSTLLLAGLMMLSATASAGVVAPIGIRALNENANSAPVNGLIVKLHSKSVVGAAKSSDHVVPLSQDQIQGLSGIAGVQLTYVRPMSSGLHVVKLPINLSVTQAQGLADVMSADPMVEYAEVDARMYASLTPNDTFYANQWHYHASASHGMNLPGAWDITTGSAAITTAVIDTGILPHIDLAGRTVSGYDMITSANTANDGGGRDADPTDPGDWITSAESTAVGGPYENCTVSNSSWHGTHVAGTVGAASNNNQGVAGVDWSGKILPVRVLGKCGGVTSDIVDAMKWSAGIAVAGVPANANPADVLNLSLGGAGVCGATMQATIDQIVALGKVIVVAAGNSNTNVSGHQPANCNNVITVAAHGPTSLITGYSNFGAGVDIMAPGGATPLNPGGVASTLDLGTTTALNDNQYVYYQGTSMAAPHVAGLAALMLSANGTLTPAQVTTVIQGTSRAFVPAQWCANNPNNCGAGIADAQAAVSAVASVTAPTVLAASASSSSQIDLSWTDNATNETGYKVERKIGVGGAFAQIGTAAANATSYNDTTAVAETTYYYRVRAYSPYNNSSYSSQANAAALAAPSSLSGVAASTTQIDLTWTDNSAIETSYKIEQSSNGTTYSQVGTTAANVATYSATGLTAGTTYYFRVRASSTSGNSSYSTAAAVTTASVAAGGGGSFSPWLLLVMFPLSLMAIRRVNKQ